MNLASISLDDKYTVDSGTIYITGSQALVRLPLMQIQRDRAAGNSTACFISGYRGSPMHNLDKELWRAKQLIGDHPVHFQPAVNEDLAATSACVALAAASALRALTSALARSSSSCFTAAATLLRVSDTVAAGAAGWG